MRHTATRLALVGLLWAVLSGAPAAAQSTCHADDWSELATCITNAAGGDTITVAVAEIAVTSRIELPDKAGASYITIQPLGGCPFDRRATPEDQPSIPTFTLGTNFGGAFLAQNGAHHYKFDCLAWENNTQNFTTFFLGLSTSEQDTLAEVPHHFIFDRNLCYAPGTTEHRRCWFVNASDVTITRSHCENIKEVNGESQCIGILNTPGPVTITDNYLEAANINILSGGGEIHLPEPTVPTNILIDGNTITKRDEWKSLTYTEKNLFELKCADQVIFRNNILDGSWVDGQNGQAILLTPRGWANPAEAWCTVSNVTIERNKILDVCQAFQITGITDGEAGDVSSEAHDLVIQDNLIVVNDLTGACTNSNLYTIDISYSPDDLAFRRNTIDRLGIDSASTYLIGLSNANGATPTGFEWVDNVTPQGDYGIFLAGGTLAKDALDAYFVTYTWTGNCMGGWESEGWGDSTHLPQGGGNVYPATYATFQALFTDFAGGDYSLVPSGVCDGKGVDFSLLPGGEEAPVIRYRLRLRGMG